MVGIVLVSHSHLQAKGLQEMALQAAQNQVKVASAGGIDTETLGTNAERIYGAIQEVYSPADVLILFDLGSALMSTELAIRLIAVSLETLRLTPWVIGVGGGIDKAAAVLGALRLGLLDCLVTDDLAARAVLKMADQ